MCARPPEYSKDELLTSAAFTVHVFSQPLFIVHMFIQPATFHRVYVQLAINNVALFRVRDPA